MLGWSIVIGGVVGALALFVAVVAGVEYAYEDLIQCPSFGAAVERPVKYTWWTGCFVQAKDGSWYHANNYWNSPEKEKQ